MTAIRIETAEEIGAKRAFRWAVDWPGWCRSGRDPDRALDALLAAAPRYAVVVARAGFVLPGGAPGSLGAGDLPVIESGEGGGGTDFGVPSWIADSDRRPVPVAESVRLAALVRAAWLEFDDVVAAAPAELRKGPRGGGRDRDRIAEHVVNADHAYAHEMGLRVAPPSWLDRASVEAEREAMLEELARPSDGSPPAGRRWTARYAARRIAWHALDHAWEIEDRTERQEDRTER